MPCLTARFTGRSAGGVLRERAKADGLRARFTGKVYGQISPFEMRTPLFTNKVYGKMGYGQKSPFEMRTPCLRAKNDPKMSDI